MGALSSHSPSATLQSSSVTWKGALHANSALILTPGVPILQLPPGGSPLTVWLWWPRGPAFLGPMGLWQSEGWFLAGCHSQALCRQQLGHSPQPLWKGSLLACQGLWYARQDLSLVPVLWPPELLLSREVVCGHHLGARSLSLALSLSPSNPHLS